MFVRMKEGEVQYVVCLFTKDLVRQGEEMRDRKGDDEKKGDIVREK